MQFDQLVINIKKNTEMFIVTKEDITNFTGIHMIVFRQNSLQFFVFLIIFILLKNIKQPRFDLHHIAELYTIIPIIFHIILVFLDKYFILFLFLSDRMFQSLIKPLYLN